MNPYQNNILEYEVKAVQLGKVLKRLSVLRVLTFVFSIALIVFLVYKGLPNFIWIVAPLCTLGFILLIKRYNRIAYQKQHAAFLQEINEGEVLRLENKLSAFPTGQAYSQRDHPYVADLDIFGTHSLYQLINRTTTESGSGCLAAWLSEPASREIILERQQAIEELSPQLEWRQNFQASGLHYSNAKSDYQKLLSWIEKPVELLPHQAKYLFVCGGLAVLSTAAAIYAFPSGEVLPWAFLFAILLLNFFILKKVAPLAEDIIDSTHENIKILAGYESLIIEIEKAQFHSERLQQLQSVFSRHNYSAAGEINKLRNILEIFQLRGTRKSGAMNQFYPLFDIFWLLDIYLILLTENWKNRNSAQLRVWASAVGEFEVLSSLAAFSYSNPSYVFPAIKEGACTVEFEMLGHPLISPEKRVCNDFNLKARDKIAMITGSNMAGKSTFLRTVGINLVLAYMGAPCCAKSALLTNMILFSSMRTQDNLEEGVSSFYAELKKVEQLLKLIESGQAVFFLLDEMFKGTNSQDRHKGGFSLIKQLEELNAFGMISTHDLELASLAGSHGLVTNYSFNSEIREGEMFFSYALTPGLCKDFNASELMKKSGIKILSHIEKMP